ncbi:hypothetical protein FCM35_KLT15724 [Carex littledalei]|uniref:Uncharacterized protein n=1 Tax=Carex littledalei TaxID=544730 RepID=A0A833RS59_9POAL|nr:hypothetical protein FCM35_KLT15724 [Carex littledalei]
MVFGTVVRWAAKKGKPKMKPVELTSPPEQTLSISRAIFDVVKEHGPLTISDTWDHVKNNFCEYILNFSGNGIERPDKQEANEDYAEVDERETETEANMLSQWTPQAVLIYDLVY